MISTRTKTLIAVAEERNFTKAADRLSLTQPAVSHQIKSLEDELGVKLFIRTSKSVRLTREGHAYIPYASDIVKLAGLSLARMRACQEEQPLRLGIGCRNTAQMALTGQTLRRMRQEGAALLPVFRLIPFDSLENLLQEGDIQMMFAYKEAVPRGGRYRELIQCPVVCLCAPDHPLAEHGTVCLEELKGAKGL